MSTLFHLKTQDRFLFNLRWSVFLEETFFWDVIETQAGHDRRFQNVRKLILNDIKNVTCNSDTLSNILVGQNVFPSFLAFIYCQNKIFFNKHVHIKYSFVDRNKRIELLIWSCFFNDLYFWTINLKSYRLLFRNQTLRSSNSFWDARIASVGSHFQIPDHQCSFRNCKTDAVTRFLTDVSTMLPSSGYKTIHR